MWIKNIVVIVVVVVVVVVVGVSVVIDIDLLVDISLGARESGVAGITSSVWLKTSVVVV